MKTTKKQPQFSKTQRARIGSIGMDVACIMTNFEWKRWRGEDSRSAFQEATDAAMAIDAHIARTGKDVFRDEDIEFETFAARIAAVIETGTTTDWTLAIPRMVAAIILEDVELATGKLACARCGEPITSRSFATTSAGERCHVDSECKKTPERKEVSISITARVPAEWDGGDIRSALYALSFPVTDFEWDEQQEPDEVHRCDDCNEVWTEVQLVIPIPNLEQRLDPGGTVPSGECPACGALCYPEQEAD